MVKIDLSLFSNILNLCKELHWVTESYAKHMALDQAYDDFSDLFDKYVEVALGIYGRGNSISSPKTIKLVSDDEILLLIKEELLNFNRALTEINSQYSQLSSIFDEIKGVENQLLYRLSMVY